MKKLIVLLVVIFVMLGTIVAFAAAPVNWCTVWPEEDHYYDFWAKEEPVVKTCDHPEMVLKTWVFVHGWSKIRVERAEFFWEIFKYPWETAGVLQADLTWFGVSSNSGGSLKFTFNQYLNWDPNLWKNPATNLPYYNPTLPPDFDINLKRIPVTYWLIPKIWVDDPNNTDPLVGTWEPDPNGQQIDITSGAVIPISPCCYQWDLFQQLIINSKQLKGVYYGELLIQFEVTCFTAQTGDPFRPTDTYVPPVIWPSGGWTLIETSPAPTPGP